MVPSGRARRKRWLRTLNEPASHRNDVVTIIGPPTVVTFVRVFEPPPEQIEPDNGPLEGTRLSILFYRIYPRYPLRRLLRPRYYCYVRGIVPNRIHTISAEGTPPDRIQLAQLRQRTFAIISLVNIALAAREKNISGYVALDHEYQRSNFANQRYGATRWKSRYVREESSLSRYHGAARNHCDQRFGENETIGT